MDERLEKIAGMNRTLEQLEQEGGFTLQEFWEAFIKFAIKNPILQESVIAETTSLPEYTRPAEFLAKLFPWLREILPNHCAPWQAILQFTSGTEGPIKVAQSLQDVPPQAAHALTEALRREIVALLGQFQSYEEKHEDETSFLGEPHFDESGILHWDAMLIERLESLSDTGKKLADNVRNASMARREQWDLDHKASQLWHIWTDPQGYALLLALSVWPVVRKKLELEHKGNARFPRELAKTFSRARIEGGTRQGDHIRVIPPQGVALTLPFDLGVVKNGSNTVGLRQVISAPHLHTYLATQVIYIDCGAREDGSFEIEGPSHILDIKGAKKESRIRNGQRYESHSTQAKKRILEHLDTFSKIQVVSVGDFEMKGGDALLSELKQRSTGKTLAFAHSRLVAMHLRTDFIQIPREVCSELNAEDIPLALGIAAIIRNGANAYITKGKLIEATIFDVLKAAGVDSKSNLKKDGPSYLEHAKEAIVRISEVGKLGSVKPLGTGKDLILEVTPSDVLKDGYKRLADASKKRAKEERLARVSIAKDKARCAR